MGFNTSLKQLHRRIDEIKTHVDKQMGIINSQVIEADGKLENFMTQTNAVQKNDDEII